MTPFKLTEELVQQIEQLIDTQQDAELLNLLGDVHYADIAEMKLLTSLSSLTAKRPPMSLPNWTTMSGKPFSTTSLLKRSQENLES